MIRTFVLPILSVLACILLIPFFLPSRAQALDNMQAGESIVLPANAVVNENYFAAGNNVVVSGTVNGDAYVAGGNVIIEGTINGDLLAAGGSVTIRGHVTQDVRAVGGQITVSGAIDKNLTIAGGTATISNEAKLLGSVVSGVGNLSVLAPVAKDIQLGAGNVTIANAVGGNVQAGVGTLHLTSDATVAGSLAYWSQKSAQIDAGATIGQGVSFHEVKQPQPDANRQRELSRAAFSGFKVINLLSSVLVGLLLLALTPLFMQQMTEAALAAPWKALGVGFLALIATPIAVIFLLATIIGIPLALILGVMYLIMIYLAKLITSLALGHLLFRWGGAKAGLVWVFLAGYVVYAVIQFIPIIGGIASFLSLLFGLGALIMYKYSFYHSLRHKKLI